MPGDIHGEHILDFGVTRQPVDAGEYIGHRRAGTVVDRDSLGAARKSQLRLVHRTLAEAPKIAQEGGLPPALRWGSIGGNVYELSICEA